MDFLYYFKNRGDLMNRSIVGVMVIAALGCGIASAGTHYVSPNGADIYPYTSWENAADSIQKGIGAASSGDTVRVGAGTYREIVMMIPGIVLLGAGMDSSIIYPYKNSGRDIVYGQDSSVIEGFHIRGWEPSGEDYCIGIYNSVDANLKRISNNRISECDVGTNQGMVNTEVSNNIFEDNRTGIASGFGDKILVINNTFTDNYRAMTMWLSAGPTIIKNLIVNTTVKAIEGDFTDSMFFENNLVVVGKYYGIYLESYGGFKNAPIRNNTLIGDTTSFGEFRPQVVGIGNFSNEIRNNIISKGYYGIVASRHDGYDSNPQVSYNDLWNNVDNYHVYGTASIDTSLGGNIYLDPMFVGGGDYHLQYGSPCIDAGDPNIKDPDSSRSDIGCYGGAYGETYTYQDYPPKAPDSLSANSLNTVIVLSWKPNTESDLSHYLVYRDTIQAFIPDTLKIVANIPKDSSVFRDHDFVMGKTYYYQVSALDLTAHQSEYSDELEVEATSVGEYTEEENRPPVYRLFQNYPNPFNSSTVIWYFLPDVGYQPAEVEITVYNILGKVVRTLVNKRQFPGNHRILWDGKDDSGDEVASGIYFCKLKVSGLELAKPRKMVLLR
jgi:nitrous oxidase accessory protein NosD